MLGITGMAGFGGHYKTAGGADADAMDTHTGYTETSGTCDASTEFSGTYVAWKGCNDNNAAANDWISQSGGIPAWWRYNFTTAQKSGGYTLEMSNVTYFPYMPKDWTFEGSHDGTDWDVLDTQSGITTWSAQVKRTFLITNYIEYEWYRFNITAVQSGAYAEVTEFEILI